MIAPSSWKLLVSHVISSLHFSLPLEYFINLSFGGASEANPGMVEYGGLFWDPFKRTRLIYATQCGYATNSEAKFNVVKQGLLIAIRLGYRMIVIEGDLKMVTEIIKHLNQSAIWENLSHNWCTTKLVLEVREPLPTFDYFLSSHV